MIFEGLSQLIGGFVANSQHKKYAELLMNQKMTMPGAVQDAEGILKGNAGEGLPGYESYLAEVNSLLPNTVNAAREVVDNPSQLLEAISRAQSTAGSKIRDLGIADADAKLQNEVAYANFLSNVKAPVQQQMENFDIQKTLGAQQERMMGKAEMWKGLGSFGNTLDSITLAAADAGMGNIPTGFKSMFQNSNDWYNDFGQYLMRRDDPFSTNPFSR